MADITLKYKTRIAELEAELARLKARTDGTPTCLIRDGWTGTPYVLVPLPAEAENNRDLREAIDDEVSNQCGEGQILRVTDEDDELLRTTIYQLVVEINGVRYGVVYAYNSETGTAVERIYGLVPFKK